MFRSYKLEKALKYFWKSKEFNPVNLKIPRRAKEKSSRKMPVNSNISGKSSAK